MYVHNIRFLVASGAHSNVDNEVVVPSPETRANVQNMSDAVSSLSLSGAEQGEKEFGSSLNVSSRGLRRSNSCALPALSAPERNNVSSICHGKR